MGAIVPRTFFVVGYRKRGEGIGIVKEPTTSRTNRSEEQMNVFFRGLLFDIG